MRRTVPIFYSALMLTGVNLLLRLVSTSFQVYISGRIGAAGVGLLQLVLSVGTLAMTAGMAGIRTSTMYLTAEEIGKKRPENVKWVLSGCYVYSIICSGIVAVALYTFAPAIAKYWICDIQTTAAIRLYSGFLPVTCLCGVMTGYFTAANRIGTLAAVEVAEQLLSVTVTMCILRLYAGNDPAKACQSIILGSGISACMTLACLMILRCKEHCPDSKKIPVRSRLLQAAVPLALADNLKIGINTTENLMVPQRLSLFPGVQDPLAAFGMVCGMVFPVLMFPAAILFGLAELLIPELARCAAAGSQKRIAYLVRRGLRVALIYGCIFCGFMYLLSGELCTALYRNREAGTYLRRFSLLIPMLYCDAITDAMTKGLGQQKICVRYNILTSAMDVVLLFILLPQYGIDGYFTSFLITHLINFILSFRRLLRISGKVLSPLVPMVSVCAAGIGIFAASFVGDPITKCFAYLAVLGCLLFLLGIVSKEDIRWLKGLVTKNKTGH